MCTNLSDAEALRQAANDATHVVMTPYFIPPEGLAGALALAAHRGVDVRVYVPDPMEAFLRPARGQPLRDAAAAGVSVSGSWCWARRRC